MPSTLSATTSTLTGPSMQARISRTRRRMLPGSAAAASFGLVVHPEITPRAAACRTSSRSALSMKSSMLSP